MSLLQRVLLAVALLFTCTTVAVFTLHVLSIRDEITRADRTHARDAPERNALSGDKDSDILSRMSLLPWIHRKRSLVAVMIENHEDARPHQKGLEEALLVVEFPVEGFITRFAAIFDRRGLPSLIGPVRSLRPYFVDAFLPWRPPFLHAGGSPEAFDRIALTETPAVNGLKYPEAFLRDETIPAPHNLFINDDDVLRLTEDSTGNPVRWPPYDVSGSAQGHSGATVITVNFLSPVHNVQWIYDHFFQRYHRENGGAVSAVHPTNVLLMEIAVTEIGEHGRLTIPVEGSGRALLFRNGTVTPARWRRNSLEEWFTWETRDGESLRFAQGKTWITAVQSVERVKWEKRE